MNTKSTDDLSALLENVVRSFNTAFAYAEIEQEVFADEDEFDRKELLCWRAIQLAVYAGDIVAFDEAQDRPEIQIWAAEVSRIAYPMFDNPIVNEMCVPTIDHDLVPTASLDVEETRSLAEWHRLLGNEPLPERIYLDGVLSALAEAGNRRIESRSVAALEANSDFNPQPDLMAALERVEQLESYVTAVHEFQRPAFEQTQAGQESLKVMLEQFAQSLSLTRKDVRLQVEHLLGAETYRKLSPTCSDSIISTYMALTHPELRDGAMATAALARALEAELKRRIFLPFAQHIRNYTFASNGRLHRLSYGEILWYLRNDPHVQRSAHEKQIDALKIAEILEPFNGLRNKAVHGEMVRLEEAELFWDAVCGNQIFQALQCRT